MWGVSDRLEKMQVWIGQAVEETKRAWISDVDGDEEVETLSENDEDGDEIDSTSSFASVAIDTRRMETPLRPLLLSSKVPSPKTARKMFQGTSTSDLRRRLPGFSPPRSRLSGGDLGSRAIEEVEVVEDSESESGNESDNVEKGAHKREVPHSNESKGQDAAMREGFYRNALLMRSQASAKAA